MNESDAPAIAIVGLSGRFPGAHNVEQFWSNLIAGVNSIATLSDEDLLAGGVDARTLADASYVRRRGLVPDHEMFDASFFGYSPREAELMDPQQRLLLQHCYAALNHAGYAPNRVPGRVGVYVSATRSTHPAFLSATTSTSDADPRVFQGNTFDHIASRVAYKLNLQGPSMYVASACSSSLVGVHLACQGLLTGDSDMALAGGVSVDSVQARGYLYQSGGILSPDGECRAFDKLGKGAVSGGGVGVVVLRRLEDAIADGDEIHAVILGSAVNNDGADRVGYTAPSVNGQAQVLAQALAAADVDAASIGYIEAHGTATPVGDPIEIAALARVFGDRPAGFAGCGIGSVKTNIGHLDAAAGVAGLIKTVLVLQHGVIPATLHFTELNPLIDLDGTPFSISSETRTWEPGPGPRRAGVSSFGFGGANAHVVLEQAPPRRPRARSRRFEALVTSARTASAADRGMADLTSYLGRNPALSLADAAHTLIVGRELFPERRAVVCSRAPELVIGDPQTPTIRGSAGLVMMFGDSGSWSDEAQRLYDLEPQFRSSVEHCRTAWRSMLGPDRPALESFELQYALARLVRSWGVEATAYLGVGIGEHVAAHLTGTLSLTDALALVAREEPGHSIGEALAAVASLQQHVLVDFGSGELAAQLVADDRCVLSARAEEADLARLAAALWVNDIEIDWSAVRGHRGGRRIPLPAYPFERTKFPVHSRQPFPDRVPARERALVRADPKEWLWISTWRETPPLAPPTLAGDDHGSQLFVVFGTADGLAGAVVDDLQARGLRVAMVTAGPAFAQWAPGEFELRPDSPGDYSRLLAEIDDHSTGAYTFVHTWCARPSAGDDKEQLAEAQSTGPHSLICLARALANTGTTGEIQILGVTTGAYDVTGYDHLHPANSQVLGPLRVIQQELPHVRCRSVDLDADGVVTDSALERLVAEFFDDTDEPATAHRRGRRWVQSVAQLPAVSDPVPVIRRGGVYLITGGLGKIGLKLAEHLIETAHARVVLLGRSAVRRENWDTWILAHGDEDEMSQLIRRLQAIEERGGEVLVVPASVGDQAAVNAAVREAHARFGPINGVVHAAGGMGGESTAYINELDPADCDPQFSSKVWGTVALDRATRDDPLDFVVLMSSISVLLGGVQLAAYAGANAFLDAYARQRGRDGVARWISVNWDAWLFDDKIEEGTLGATWNDVAMSPDDGIATFERALRTSGFCNVTVSTTDLNDRITRWVRRPRAGEAVSRSSVTVPVGASQDWIAHEVVEIWRDLLGVGAVSTDDSFFALGGDSLLALQLMRNLQESFGLALPLSVIFEAPTPAQLASQISSKLHQSPDASEVEELAQQIARMDDSEIEKMLAQFHADPS